MNDRDEIIAICVFIVSLDEGTTDVGWFVRADFRGKGVGRDTVEKAFNEFKNGLKGLELRLFLLAPLLIMVILLQFHWGRGL